LKSRDLQIRREVERVNKREREREREEFEEKLQQEEMSEIDQKKQRQRSKWCILGLCFIVFAIVSDD